MESGIVSPLDLIMLKHYETTLTAISFGFFVKNMERVLRLLVLLILGYVGDYGFRHRHHLCPSAV